MIDIWTRAVLVGAAFSFAAYLAMRHARRIARASDWLTHVPRPRLAAFLAFALVAMIHAQKSGTNAPLRGASVELRAESVKLRGGQSYANRDVVAMYMSMLKLPQINNQQTWQWGPDVDRSFNTAFNRAFRFSEKTREFCEKILEGLLKPYLNNKER